MFLDEKDGKQAAQEFQRILDNRYRDVFSPLYPLAHLGLARAAAMSGDMSKARTEYQNFFTAWRDADKNIPLFQQAQKEYEALK